jgi:hypothetical protein
MSRMSQPPVIGRFRPLSSWYLALVVALVGCGAALFAFNPADHSFYPRCVFHQVTGWNCPGCGGLRAMHQLLRGNLAAAWELNPLAVLLVPVFGWFLLDWWLAAFRGRGLPKPTLGTRTVWVLIGVLVTFGVLRNLPWR